MSGKKIADIKTKNLFLVLCWLVYFSSYLMRLNYNAVMVEMIAAEGVTKAAAGMIGTGAFITYGVGQIVSGILGDRYSPRLIMFGGLTATVLCNYLMLFAPSMPVRLVIWCCNGFAQSMLWPPMLRLFAEYYNRADFAKKCVHVSTSCAAGTIAVYLLAPACILLSGWKAIFLVSGTFGLLVAVIWLIWSARIARTVEAHGVVEEAETAAQKTQGKLPRGLLAGAGLFFMMGAIMLQGMLKDGVSAWMPTFISETYRLGSAVSILSTVVMPICNMLALYAAAFFNNRVFHNEAVSSAVFFGVSLGASLLLRLCITSGAALSVAAASILTSCMHGVNLMIITVVPAYFIRYGKVSTLSGLLNAFTYVGSAASTYGIGALSQHFGWNMTLTVWCAVAAVGTVLCLLAVRPWTRFTRSRPEEDAA